jgi:hypothetical protein
LAKIAAALGDRLEEVETIGESVEDVYDWKRGVTAAAQATSAALSRCSDNRHPPAVEARQAHADAGRFDHDRAEGGGGSTGHGNPRWAALSGGS